MLEYSVAIRTLGKAPDTLRQELESLHRQTIRPKEIIIYIAKGYQRPSFTVGIERYVEVEKGMVAQRALRYDEISSDCILLLDDDVELAPDSAEKLLAILNDNNADCVAADTFQTHNMGWLLKIRAALVNFSLPRFDQKWAVTVRPDDSFSYINNPSKSYYLTQSAAGPAAIWKTESFRKMNFQDELWLDDLGFAYGDDGLEFFKLHLNGGVLLMAFDIGMTNLNARTSSSHFQKSADRFSIMAKSNVCRWHRMHYSHKRFSGRFLAVTMFSFKACWQLSILSLLSVKKSMRLAPKMYAKGLLAGMKFLKSERYRSLPPYKFLSK